jgi:branched-chain amino acid transport system permease protein
MAADKFVTSYKQEIKLLGTRARKNSAIGLGVLMVILPFLLNADLQPPLNFPWYSWSTVLNLTITAVIGAAAFNLLVGNTGQVSLAHAGLLILGAVSGGWLGPILGLNFFLVLPLTLIIGALAGFIIALPALRLKGLYLLLATLGIYYFGQFAYKKFLVSQFGFLPITYDYPKVPSWVPFLNSAEGDFLINSNFRWYWVNMPIAILSLLFLSNVIRTSEGRAFAAVKARDNAASLVGVNPVRSKMKVFMLSSAFVTMAGAMQSWYLGARDESSFPFQVTLNYAIMIVIGGFSSILGAIFGALFFFGAPEWIDWIRNEVPGLRSIEFLATYKSEINLGVFGLLIVFVLVRSPEGLFGIWTRIKNYFINWPFSK